MNVEDLIILGALGVGAYLFFKKGAPVLEQQAGANEASGAENYIYGQVSGIGSDIYNAAGDVFGAFTGL